MAEDANKTAAAPEGGAAPAAEGAPEAGNGKQKKLLMLASAALAVIGVIVAVGVFFVFGGKKAENPGEKPAAEVGEMATFDVPEFTLNLLTDEQGGGPRFLKIQLALELQNQADSANMTKLLPRLQDDWGNFLRQLRPTDLQGSAALQRLKEGLLRRATQTLEPVEVRAVYIRDMLVQ
ncbi:MAG: flagellar basal body-associated FliL family protein [Alphaproteobacteria bacterium]|nr:flagellar basal body-associated FliL family protein [Alphaproteobacteria bacterium]